MEALVSIIIKLQCHTSKISFIRSKGTIENPGDGKEREVRAGGRLTKQRQSQLGQWWGESGLVPEEGGS